MTKQNYWFADLRDETIRIEKYLEKKFETESDNIFRFLNHIFYKFDLSESYEHQNNHQDSIVRVKRFYLYFNYTNFDNVLAYQEFKNAYNSSEEDFFKEIEKWVNQDLGIELSERLGSINNFNTKYDLEKYARATILFYDLFKSYKTLDYFKYKVNNKELIEEYYDGSSEKMIESIFQPFRKNNIRRKFGFIESFDSEKIIIFQNTFLKLFDTPVLAP